MAATQYRLAMSKTDERVEGPDSADVELAVPIEAYDAGATVAFMRGKLKASGNTGTILDLLRSGEADRVFAELRR